MLQTVGDYRFAENVERLTNEVDRLNDSVDALMKVIEAQQKMMEDMNCSIRMLTKELEKSGK